MTIDGDPAAGSEPATTASNREGLYSAILTAVVTVVTFGHAANSAVGPWRCLPWFSEAR